LEGEIKKEERVGGLGLVSLPRPFNLRREQFEKLPSLLLSPRRKFKNCPGKKPNRGRSFVLNSSGGE